MNIRAVVFFSVFAAGVVAAGAYGSKVDVTGVNQYKPTTTCVDALDWSGALTTDRYQDELVVRPDVANEYARSLLSVCSSGIMVAKKGWSLDSLKDVIKRRGNDRTGEIEFMAVSGWKIGNAQKEAYAK